MTTSKAEIRRKSYLKNIEKRRAEAREKVRNLSPEDKKKRYDAKKEWARNNPDKVKFHAKRKALKDADKIKVYKSEYHEKHKERLRAEQKRRYQLNKDKVWEDNLSKTFGMTLQEYNHILAYQGGRCGICQCLPEEETRKFAVDHCHVTGKIRGILCRGCNVGIGNLKDDVEVVQAALAYLKNGRHR